MRLVAPISLSTASGIWRWLFCQKRQLRPHNPWCWNYQTSESENKGKPIVLCLQQHRGPENSELNCQVCQSANGYTMGPTSLGFNQLPATASNLVITTPRTSRIYFLLRIHKPNNPGRPIVSAYSCHTELTSILLDKIVAPVVRSLPSHIKDSRQAFKILRDFKLIVPVEIHL